MSVLLKGIRRATVLYNGARTVRNSEWRSLSSRAPSGKDIDDKLISEWKEDIQRREEAKKTLATEDRNRFIEEKKRQLAESENHIEHLAESVRSHEAKMEPVQEPINGSPQTEPDLRVSGSYQQLVKKIHDNENFQQLKQELKKYNEQPSKPKVVREDLGERLRHSAEELRNAFPIMMRIINDLTGYTKVENLKADISSKEELKNVLKEELAAAKHDYNKSIELRSMSQKQINELLQRQNSWSLEDLEKFTELYKNDHTLEKQEHESQERLQELEAKKDENDEKLITSILTRYHEEQVWSDKIRKFSTWGTIAIMGVNLFLFIVVQLVFEPFKRKRLVNAFEAKVKQLLEESDAGKTPTAKLEAEKSLIATSESIENSLLLEIDQVENMLHDMDQDTVKFTVPDVRTVGLRAYLTQLFSTVSANILKIFNFRSSATQLVVDRVQLNILFAIGVVLSFSCGLMV